MQSAEQLRCQSADGTAREDTAGWQNQCQRDACLFKQVGEEPQLPRGEDPHHAKQHHPNCKGPRQHSVNKSLRPLDINEEAAWRSELNKAKCCA